MFLLLYYIYVIVLYLIMYYICYCIIFMLLCYICYCTICNCIIFVIVRYVIVLYLCYCTIFQCAYSIDVELCCFLVLNFGLFTAPLRVGRRLSGGTGLCMDELPCYHGD